MVSALIRGILYMKGIVLAGGAGTRLYPLTMVTSKQLLPIYDKPMIFYPLSTLMMAGIKDILIISTPQDLPNFRLLLGDGKQYGINLFYEEQPYPDGLAQAFIIGESFINGDSCALILGDNIFYGNGLGGKLKRAYQNSLNNKCTMFGYYVNDPERFGVIEFSEDERIISVEEKPKNPKSNYIATGLYFYNNSIVEYAKRVKPSPRGELEITDLNNLYIKEGKMELELLGRGNAWLDTGTMESLLEASNFVSIVETRQGIQIAALEEIAYYNGWITKEELLFASKKFSKSLYGKHLKLVAEDKFRK